MLGLKKKPKGSWNLWLEPLPGYDIHPILELLGVDDVDAAAEAYVREFKNTRRLVKSVDRRERDVEYRTETTENGSEYRVPREQAKRQVQTGLDSFPGE